FSKDGLYDQLVYEKYTPEQAQYAIDNINADWNENALQAAKDYLDYSAFSKDGLYDQLVYEKYTPEQAQYAIDNLPN
ncbi:Ltp family lipoprotein, partial [Enterococcus faecium]